MGRVKAFMRAVGYRLIRRSLRQHFRRIVWVGPWRPPPIDEPVVAYANHHVFYDSFALGFLLECILHRRVVVWMEDHARFPFFGAVGAMPFPPDDARQRVRTIRRTTKLMEADCSTAMIYFPEGRLHAADDGVLDFEANRFARLSRVVPDAWWWPIAIRVTGWHEASPTLLMSGGTPHRSPTGEEAAVLDSLVHGLTRYPAKHGRVLLKGRRGPDERWDFSRRIPTSGVS